jgi:hypothetical protein
LLLLISSVEQLGWPDNWETGIGWELRGNDCRWCPADGGGCAGDHQSPIDLDRNTAIAGDPNENECIDVHWMKYYDSSCSWSELERLNAFSIERHALKVVQPVELVGGTSDTWRIMCERNAGAGGREFGRIDFSKGFSQWWHLSHLDLHVPSEHTQEGKRYAGEIQLHHFYSVSEEEAGVANQVRYFVILSACRERKRSQGVCLLSAENGRPASFLSSHAFVLSSRPNCADGYCRLLPRVVRRHSGLRRPEQAHLQVAGGRGRNEGGLQFALGV